MYQGCTLGQKATPRPHCWCACKGLSPRKAKQKNQTVKSRKVQVGPPKAFKRKPLLIAGSSISLQPCLLSTNSAIALKGDGEVGKF